MAIIHNMHNASRTLISHIEVLNLQGNHFMLNCIPFHLKITDNMQNTIQTVVYSTQCNTHYKTQCTQYHIQQDTIHNICKSIHATLFSIQYANIQYSIHINTQH